MLMSFGILSVLTSLFSCTLCQNRNYNAPDSLFKCTEEGFHPDPRDCRAFYRCVDWGNGRALTSFKFECGVGTVFAQNKGNICVHPNESERPECGDLQNEIDPDWQNPQNSPNPQNPPNPQHSSTSTPRISSSSGYPSTARTSTSKLDSSAGKGDYATTNSQCSQEGFMEDPKDCMKFYRCVNEGFGKNIKYEFTCGTGTVWDQDIQACNHPWAVSRKDCRNSLPGSSSSVTEDQWNGDSSTTESGNLSGTPGYPSSSNYPSQPNQSYQPSYPSQPIQPYPNQPNEPVYPSQPNQPSYPSQPNQPSYPSQSNQPSYPSQSNQPSYPSQPNQPSYPSQPTQLYPSPPNEPAYPSQSNQPAYPSQPSQPGYPSQPSQPAYPSQPSQPGYPSQPSQPAYPSQPNQPAYPSQPSYPGQTNQPTSSGLPDYPARPEASSTPINPAGPGGTPTPATSVLPPRPPRPITQNPSAPQSTSSTIIDTEAPGQGSTQPGTSATPGQSESASASGICSNEGFYPDPENCRKFYRCVKDGSAYTKYEFECGTGTGWDSKLQTCNHLYLIPNCDSDINTTGDNNVSDPSTSTDNLTTKQPNNQSPSSTVDPSINVSSNSPSTSSGSNNIMSTSTTGGTSATGPETISSTYLPPNTVGPSIPSYGISSTPSSLGTSSLTSPQSSSQISTQGIPAETSTDSSQISSTTSSPTNSASPTESTKPGNTGCQGDGFFPNINDCKKFYRCVKDPSGYRRFDFDCGPGTAWDQGLQTCNYIAQVSSCQSSNNEIEQGSSGPSKPPGAGVPEMTSSSPDENVDKPGTPIQQTEMSSTTTTNIPSSDIPEGMMTPVDSSTASPSSPSTENSDSSSKPPSEKPDCSPPKQNTTIVCNVAGFYPHPTRCDKFYRCVDNGNGFNVYHFDCAPGTIFDPSISVCNYAESVYPARDCSMGPGSSTESGDSVSSTTSTKPSSSEKPVTSTEEMKETTTAMNPSESTTSKEENVSEESTPMSETTVSPSEMTTSETATTDANLESSTSETGNEPTEMSTDSGSEATTQTEDNSATTESSATTQSNEAGSTEASAGMTEESSMSSAQESTTEAGANQETTQTPSETTEESSSGSSESTTQPSDMGAPTPSSEPALSNCPVAADLTDDQVLLVCPSGFRRHPKFCNLLYQCTSEGNMQIKILMLSCPENTIFDEMKVQCLPEAESSQPCMGTITSTRLNRQTTEDNSILPVKLSTQNICPSEGHYPYQEGCSSAFYKCKNNSRGSLQGYLYKCPKDFVYWSVSRRCERATRLPMCTRLGYTSENDSWERRWEVPIEDSNLSARMLRLD